MRITKLSLTNFRSFKATQILDFAPLTLLFGPNSVGKSSVLMALFYVQQILDKGQCNPQRLDGLGNKFVGGYESLVHGKNLSERITIRIDFDKQGKIGESYTNLTDILGEQLALAMDSPASAAETMAVELEIAWSFQAKTAYVARYRVCADDELLAEITSDDGLKQPMVTAINYLHPLLLPANHDDWLLERFECLEDIHSAFLDRVLELKDLPPNPSHREIAQGAELPFVDEEGVSDFSDDSYVSVFHELLNDSRITQESRHHLPTMSDDSSLIHVPIGIRGFAGALPLLGRSLHSTLTLESGTTNEVIKELLSDMLVAPLDNLLGLLNDSLCIGPLRHIPDPTYQVNSYPSQGDWYDGKACWDTLQSPEFLAIDSVNDWVAGSNRLNLGYKLVNKKIKGESTYAVGATDSPVVKNNFNSSQLTLWDIQNNLEVFASEVGAGVSQLLPLVVAALTRRKGGLVMCEQPELHVHPRVQVNIGDLLTQSNNKARFLIETHSEHLILRILKRIRQTSDDELPEGITPVQPKDISILYIESTSGEVKVRKISVDMDGEFTSSWPQGFFSERREELF